MILFTWSATAVPASMWRSALVGWLRLLVSPSSWGTAYRLWRQAWLCGELRQHARCMLQNANVALQRCVRFAILGVDLIFALALASLLVLPTLVLLLLRPDLADAIKRFYDGFAEWWDGGWRVLTLNLVPKAYDNYWELVTRSENDSQCAACGHMESVHIHTDGDESHCLECSCTEFARLYAPSPADSKTHDPERK